MNGENVTKTAIVKIKFFGVFPLKIKKDFVTEEEIKDESKESAATVVTN